MQDPIVNRWVISWLRQNIKTRMIAIESGKLLVYISHSNLEHQPAAQLADSGQHRLDKQGYPLPEP